MIFRRNSSPELPRRPLDIRRCLLIANQWTPTPRLCKLMEEKCSEGPCEMYVLVSRFKRCVLVSDPALRPTGEGDDRITVDDQTQLDEDELWDVAEARLDSFMRALGDLGQPISGEILAGNALKRIRSLLRIEDFDEAVVLAPPNRRRWPVRDVVSKIQRASQIPVTTVPADEIAA